MSTEPRRSSRANKGTHSGHDLQDVYYKFEDEPDAKRRKTDGEYQQESFVTESSNLGANNSKQTDDPHSDVEGDVRCDPCGTTQANYDEENDDGGMMIECERCSTWQHARCMGYKTKRAIPSHYLCNRCGDGDKEPGNAATTTTESASPLETTPEKEIVATDAKTTQTKTTELKVPANKTRQSVIRAIANVLLKHATVDDQNAQKWASQMESAIHAWSGTTDKKYIDKSRSVMALVKKANVFQRVVDGAVTVNNLVVLPPEEVDDELKDYAEKVRQELIRRSVLTVEDELSRRIRRTHKGEEIVETGSNDDEVNLNIAARNIDHRIFSEVTPARESVIGGLTGPNLYQIADDDEDDEADKKPDPQTEKSEEASDSDEELDFILGSKSPEKTPATAPKPSTPAPKLPPTMSNRFWSGDVVFPDFVQFGATATFVGCTNYEKPKDVTTASFHNRAIRVCKELLEKPRYSIEGRLDRKRADPYVDKITSSRDLYIIHIEPTDGNQDFEKLFEYLYSRSKVGVLSGRAACVKDAYLYAFDNDAPEFLNLGPISRGLYGVFVVKKDYVPVGKSILKKSLPPQQKAAPQQNALTSLDSILSKLAATPSGDLYPPAAHSPPVNQPQQLSLELTADQLQYLSQLVNQNPHVQQNPQALLSLLQNNQMPGYH